MKLSSPIDAGALGSFSPPLGRRTDAHEAARQFEAILLQQILQPVLAPSDSGDGDSGGGNMMDLACQQFAQLLAKQGGLGMAKLAVQGLKSE